MSEPVMSRRRFFGVMGIAPIAATVAMRGTLASPSGAISDFAASLQSSDFGEISWGEIRTFGIDGGGPEFVSARFHDVREIARLTGSTTRQADRIAPPSAQSVESFPQLGCPPSSSPAPEFLAQNEAPERLLPSSGKTLPIPSLDKSVDRLPPFEASVGGADHSNVDCAPVVTQVPAGAHPRNPSGAGR